MARNHGSGLADLMALADKTPRPTVSDQRVVRLARCIAMNDGWGKWGNHFPSAWGETLSPAQRLLINFAWCVCHDHLSRSWKPFGQPHTKAREGFIRTRIDSLLAKRTRRKSRR